MTWKQEIEDLERRRALLSEGADPIRLERAVAQGKLRIRDRIAALADPGSFRPRGGLTGQDQLDADGNLAQIMPSGSLTGRCTIDGRPVVVTGHDSTVRHDGSSGDRAPSYHRRNTGRAENFAYHLRLPLIRVLDAPGASVRSYEAAGRPEVVWASWADATAQLLPTVPVISVVAGAAAGLPAIEACLCHFSVIMRGNGQAFPGGPPVVKVALGADVTKEELGGADLLAPIGVIDCVADDEQEALEIVRRFLGYLPENVWQMPPVSSPGVEPAAARDGLISAISRSEPPDYDPYAILDCIVDAGSTFEIGAAAGPECITAFARVDGFPAGILIKNPGTPNRGALGVIASEKAARFLELCDSFHLPIVCFVDEPGFQGFAAETDGGRGGIIRARAKLVQAIYHTSTPWISFVIGRTHGIAGSFSRRPQGMNRHYAWPSANWYTVDGSGEKVAIYSALERHGVDDIIDPASTRQHLSEFLESAQSMIQTQLGPVTSRAAFRV